jgi:tRNA threonylcarbamoyladenosine biosynthesis protein TsaE
MRIRLSGEPAQIAFGRRIAACLQAPTVIYLEGDLGTGKTTLVRGVLRGLGHRGPVRSPTYTLLEPYELADVRLYHLDLYRVVGPEELEYLGLRDLLGAETLLFVEWPQRGGGLLPPADVAIRIDYEPTGRSLELRGVGRRGERLIAALAQPD